jgi:probable phosphoglycerate mutase
MAAELAVEIVLDARLRERDMGEWQGLTRQEVKRRYRGRGIDRYDPGYRMPGGESLEDLGRRVDAAVADYRDAYRRRNLVIVTHAGPMIRIGRSLRAVTGAGAEDCDPPTAAMLEVAFCATPCGCGGDVMAERPGSR